MVNKYNLLGWTAPAFMVGLLVGCFLGVYGNDRINMPETTTNVLPRLTESIVYNWEMNPPAKEAGKNDIWSSWQSFEATAYTNHDPGCNNITKTSHVLCPSSRVVAVDPAVIPLGSTVEVEGFGVFYALDVGGVIKGKKIDLFHWADSEHDREAAFEFGKRKVKIRWKKK